MSHFGLPQRSSARRVFIAIGVALLALALTVVGVLAYATTNDFAQCSDLNNNGTQCKWVNGQMSNAFWVEGEAVPQRAAISGLLGNGTVHTFTWSVTWSSQQYYHGYDWLVSYNQAQQLHQDVGGAPLDLNLCTNTSGALEAICDSLRNPTVPGSTYSYTIDVPDDTFVSGGYVKTGDVLPRIQAFEAKYGNRTVTLWTDAQLVGTPVITFYHSLDDKNFTPIGNGGDFISGATLVRYTVVFTSAAVNSFMVEYAGHFAISGNPYTDPMAWGWDQTHGGYGAAGLYPSAPWHVKDPTMDDGAGNVGSQDNQAKVQNPSLYPIVSSATYTTTNHQVTDAITLTTASNDSINGTMQYWLCGPDTNAPTYPSLVNGCTTTTTATYVGSVAVTPSGKTAHGKSLVFTIPTSGRYCFLTVFIPDLGAGVSVRNFAPTSDTNSTTECFNAYGPNAVTLNTVQASTPTNEPPVAAILLGLLAIVGGITVWRLKSKRQSA